MHNSCQLCKKNSGSASGACHGWRFYIMATVTNPLFSCTATGAFGSAIIYQKTGSRFTAQQWHKPAARPSAAQILQRGAYALACADWQALTKESKTEWAAIAAPLSLSGFNAFMSYRLNATAPTPTPSGAINLTGAYTPPDPSALLIKLV